MAKSTTGSVNYCWHRILIDTGIYNWPCGEQGQSQRGAQWLDPDRHKRNHSHKWAPYYVAYTNSPYTILLRTSCRVHADDYTIYCWNRKLLLKSEIILDRVHADDYAALRQYILKRDIFIHTQTHTHTNTHKHTNTYNMYTHTHTTHMQTRVIGAQRLCKFSALVYLLKEFTVNGNFQNLCLVLAVRP